MKLLLKKEEKQIFNDDNFEWDRYELNAYYNLQQIVIHPQHIC